MTFLAKAIYKCVCMYVCACVCVFAIKYQSIRIQLCCRSRKLQMADHELKCDFNVKGRIDFSLS